MGRNLAIGHEKRRLVTKRGCWSRKTKVGHETWLLVTKNEDWSRNKAIDLL
ncbi:hypothetical protein NLX67_02720 [Domibacillus sp. A3M-37]|uniref:hypothetical protein n=1 Tax=Domibacillus sp. A3M-37 TaxID=2962037 RepID=UPI0020B85F07|nr:hypothetical protein [Domibacillus sp. A3M-37]MCP3761304.1 hypothetical protein [Domibacillus sp. A3M-37]